MTQKKQVELSECPVARALEVIGDKWTLMIIRDAFDGIKRFGEFQKNLGLAKNILSVRLKSLTSLGLLEILPASDGSAYKEYALTEKGRDLFPIIVVFRQWGEKYMFEVGEKLSILVDTKNSKPLNIIRVQSSTGMLITPQDCHRNVIIKK
ncbi:winged helix-turn-helix transcriptional regulator [Neisseria sp. Ec49-e6-T10]|uniref:winged helix-turn-helix transcriptional regulator n=1 Tax=Neisseria sp. Ec49-e6-T10 TaxID=3140744 RepID=UPI003EBC381A